MPEKGETRHYLQRTDEEKREILAEYDSAPYGEKSAVLAKYWICYSHIHLWRRMFLEHTHWRRGGSQ